jgi:formate hydrogenlyase transcriptional activator
LNYSQVNEVRERLAEERVYLNEEIRTDHNFEEIIGDSQALKEALSQVKTVAPTDSTALILGETGTGKELIARAIHNISPRRDRTFVKVNCAAIPLGLLESELFGHEKGAFTGAIAQKIGRFEFADKGTLFLDEVGDIPLELQPKLLRVLQEQEFERLGSSRTLRVNVRLVAATSRNLLEMVDKREFRSALYYRLNVFPITVPPLRERRDDIPLLARYFAEKYSRRMNKRIETIPANTMQALTRYHWPGNIRELQNFIERAVILSKATTLQAPLGELKRFAEKSPIQNVRSLVTTDRDQILEALTAANWVLGGPGGAAERLGLKRTTLLYRMRRLGITRPAE